MKRDSRDAHASSGVSGPGLVGDTVSRMSPALPRVNMDHRGFSSSPSYVHRGFAQRYRNPIYPASAADSDGGSAYSASPLTRRLRNHHQRMATAESSSLSALNTSGRRPARETTVATDNRASASAHSLRAKDLDYLDTHLRPRQRSSDRSRKRHKSGDRDRDRERDRVPPVQQQVRFYNYESGIKPNSKSALGNDYHISTAGPVRVQYNEGSEEANRTELVQFNLSKKKRALPTAPFDDGQKLYHSVHAYSSLLDDSGVHKVRLAVGGDGGGDGISLTSSAVAGGPDSFAPDSIEPSQTHVVRARSTDVTLEEAGPYRASRLLEQLGVFPAAIATSSAASSASKPMLLNAEQVHKLLRFRKFVRSAGLSRAGFMSGVERIRALEESQTFDEDGVTARIRDGGKSRAAVKKR